MIRFQMLGSVDLRDRNGREVRSVLRRPKLLALLGYLASARPSGFNRRDTLVALLWPELDNAHARNALRQAVYALREALGSDALLARGEEELAVNAEAVWCDVREFEITLEAGQAEKSLELYRGGLLNGLHVSGAADFERWLDGEREYLRRRACEAARVLIDREAAAENLAGAAHWAFRLTELSPSDDAAVQRLIELLDRAGDRAGAVRVYEEFERRLTRDLELAPSPETEALVRRIRARREHDVTASASAPKRPGRDDTIIARRASRAWVARHHLTTLSAVVVGSLFITGWLIFGTPLGPRTDDIDHDVRRLVVLPFANLGLPEDAYFANGVTEELAARLGGTGRFHLIGSASANRYRNTTKPVSEIGKELGVDYLLEGSIRWQKSPAGPAHVRITPQLLSTTDGTQLWAQVYDEPLDDIFRVQSDIAQKVVNALDIALSDAQRRAVAAVPTQNMEAYDYFLRGNDYMRRGVDERTLRAAARLYEKAVDLDPRFVLAYSWLSRVHTRMFWRYFDHSKERLEQAKKAAERCLELAPELPETHQALAIYYGLGLQDYDRALREYAVAEASGATANLFAGRAAVRMRQGKIREAAADGDKARQLDPVSGAAAGNGGQTYDLLREYPRAEYLYDQAIKLAPGSTEPYLHKTWLYLRWDGNTQRARAVLREAETAGAAKAEGVLHAKVVIEVFDRRYEAALAMLSSEAPEIVVSDDARVVPRAQHYALIYGLMGRRDRATAYYDSARTVLEAKVLKDPTDSRLRTALGIAYAGLGRKQEAIREGLKAVELMPISKEAFKGYHHEWEVARIYTMVGEHDLAISKLEYLLSIPGHLTAAWIRMDPVWDPLRSHPRFRKLVGGGT